MKRLDHVLEMRLKCLKMLTLLEQYERQLSVQIKYNIEPHHIKNIVVRRGAGHETQYSIVHMLDGTKLRVDGVDVQRLLEDPETANRDAKSAIQVLEQCIDRSTAYNGKEHAQTSDLKKALALVRVACLTGGN